MNFEVGKAYVGTATVDREHQKVFVVLARCGRRVSLAEVKGVHREKVVVVGDREFVTIKSADGFDYGVAASVAVDIDAAFNVVGMCNG